MSSRNVYLITAGEHKPNSGKLKARGKNQVKKARDEVLVPELTKLKKDAGKKAVKDAVILTPEVERYKKTAELLAKKITARTVQSSQVYNACKQEPSNGFSGISEAIDPLMELTPADAAPNSAVIVVVDEILIKQALNQVQVENPKVHGGQVWQYIPGEGLNPQPLN